MFTFSSITCRRSTLFEGWKDTISGQVWLPRCYGFPGTSVSAPIIMLSLRPWFHFIEHEKRCKMKYFLYYILFYLYLYILISPFRFLLYCLFWILIYMDSACFSPQHMGKFSFWMVLFNLQKGMNVHIKKWFPISLSVRFPILRRCC